MYDKTFPIRGMARGDPDRICTWAVSRGAQRPADLLDYLRAVYALAGPLGLNADVVVAQSHLETDGWRSYWWKARLNSAGIGITGYAPTDDLSRTFTTGEASARAQLLHLSLYVNGATVPDGFTTSDDPRWEAAVRAGYAGIASTLDDLNGRWAVDPDGRYGEKIAARLNLMDSAGLFARIVEDAPMAYVKHTWPGLPEPVYLPDWIKVEVKLIPAKGNWWRGPVMDVKGKTKTTWHDTGNQSTNADGEWTWANNGRPNGSSGGYNGIFDGGKIIITQPFNEVVGATATPEGNRVSFSLEQALNGPGGFDGSFAVGCWVHAALCVAMGWEVDTALVKHQYWSGKWCPGQILNKGLWSRAVATTQQRASEIRAHLRGASPTPSPAPAPVVYAKPAIIPELDAISKGDSIAPAYVVADGIPFVWTGDRVKSTKPTPRFQRANRESARVGPDLKAGEEFDVDWLFQFEGEWWYLTPWLTRILASDVVRVSDTKGEAA